MLARDKARDEALEKAKGDPEHWDQLARSERIAFALGFLEGFGEGTQWQQDQAESATADLVTAAQAALRHLQTEGSYTGAESALIEALRAALARVSE